MASKLISIFIVCLLSSGLGSSPISYIQDINVSYENGQWICGTLECPTDTFDCRVQRSTNSWDSKQLDTTYSCLDMKKQILMHSKTTAVMSTSRRIDIDVETYVGADTQYFTSYGLSGSESANGVVSPEDWDALKKSAANDRRKAEDSNPSVK